MTFSKMSATAFAAAMLFAATAVLADNPAKIVKTDKGPVLADAKGMTLYVFDNDKPGQSNCYDMCAKNWPPLMAHAGDKPTGKYTIVKRKDGSMQWAYDGKPLYTWIKDQKPGDTTGDGFKGVWHAAKP